MCHNHYKENFNGWYSQPVRWYRISGRVVQLNRAVCHERPLFTLLSGRTVILNLERFNFTDSQRILDFTAGVCSAIDGTGAKVSDFIFIAVSEDVWVQEITIQSQELVFNKNGSAEVLRFEEKMSGST